MKIGLTFAGGVLSMKERLYNETSDPVVAAGVDILRYPECGLVIGTA